MINIKNVSKSFEDIKAVKDTSLTIEDGRVFGLLGTNGAGKSTLLRMMSGVIRPDEGEIYIDDEFIWDRPELKEKIFYISDDQYYFSNSTPKGMATFYQKYYRSFDMDRFLELLKIFNLEADRKIARFSKGMKKQLSIILGISSGAAYLLCDETFDGLDPVMRQGIKSLFASEIDEKGLTPVIASHNLRELEDICDHIGLLHKGGVLLSKDLEALKGDLTRVQCVLPPELDDEVRQKLTILRMERRGRLLTLTARGQAEAVLKELSAYGPVFIEALPLSLEEIFISETEVAGYDIKSLII
ncbi:MAG: ABC transporter ATP-binding protein [Eubacterium sp.]|nr:ABC transporter ATP-binding protein [Eubacterium sp.]